MTSTSATSTPRWMIAGVGLLVGLMVGAGFGAARAGTSEPETVYETRTVTSVPAECTAALDEADRMLAAAGRGFTAIAAGLRAVLSGGNVDDELAPVNAAAGEVKQGMPEYRAAAEDCRQAG